MGAVPLRRVMVAALGVLLVGSGVVAAPSMAVAQAADGGGDVEVRIVARRMAGERIEFALQESAGVEADGSQVWGERRLPSARYFPARTRVGHWLLSSPLEVGSAGGRVSSVEVRITARRLSDERVEFGLHQRTASGDWGERLLPQRRFFPAAARIGSWLVSSPLRLDSGGRASTTLEPEPRPTTTTTTTSATTAAPTAAPDDDSGLVDLTAVVQAILGREDISDESGFHPDALIVAGELAMTTLVNVLRLSEDLNQLTYHLGVAQVARGWSDTMAGEAGSFRHNPAYAEEYPPGWISAGENIALVPLGHDDDPWQALADAVKRAFKSLVDSPGHYANMVAPYFNVIGVGIAISGSTVYITQNFATYL